MQAGGNCEQDGGEVVDDLLHELGADSVDVFGRGREKREWCTFGCNGRGMEVFFVEFKVRGEDNSVE